MNQVHRIMAFFIMVLAVLLSGCSSGLTEENLMNSQFVDDRTPQQLETRMVKVSHQRFKVQIADDVYEIQKGLMWVRYMPANEGMLFDFGVERKATFWMKNTKIKLDMIWLDAERRVVEIVRNAKPCVSDPCQIYGGSRLARYVLEVNGGAFKGRLGDQMMIRP